jgi:hypothetical protein
MGVSITVGLRCNGLCTILLSGLFLGISLHDATGMNFYLNTAFIMTIILGIIYVVAVLIEMSSSRTEIFHIVMWTIIDIACWIISFVLLLSLAYDNKLASDSESSMIIATINSIGTATAILVSISLDTSIRIIRNHNSDSIVELV